jgi:TolB protein
MDMAKLVISILAVWMILIGLALAAGHMVLRGEELAYVSVEDDNYEVYLLDVNSALNYNLSRHRNRDDMPIWSPDGRQLAFVSYRAGIAQIYVANADTARLRAITSPDWSSTNPVWSPDGRQLAFISNQGGRWGLYLTDGDCQRDCDTTARVMPIQFSPQRRVFGRLVWSPDGRYLAAPIGVARGGAAIRLIDMATGELKTLNASLLDTQLAWSPDSRQLLYAARGALDLEVYAVDVSGGTPENLTGNPGYDGTPSWSPDNHQIAFASGRTGRFDIYRSNADGTQPERLTDQHVSVRPVWSPDGRWITFESGRVGKYDIYIMPADGGSPRRLTFDAIGNRYPVWRPS